MSLTVYGIPSCGTVKKARSWLEGARRPHTFADFRQTPPSAGQVKAWVAKFGARALRNTSGGSYRALGPEKETWSEAEWTAAFADDPMLIKRPVIERDGVPVIVGWNLEDAEIKARLG
ncbi:arsenate reductase [Deltaproteobacteria bacterium]|nr:arsenate reductase [Deltaproteobacteria bacterium]